MERQSTFFGDIQKWFWTLLGAVVSFGIVLPSVVESAHDQLGISDLAAYHAFCIIYFFLFIVIFVFWVLFFSKSINTLRIGEHQTSYHGRFSESLKLVKKNYSAVLVLCLALVLLVSLIAIMSNADLSNGLLTLLMFLPLFVTALIYLLHWRHPIPDKLKGNMLIILFFSVVIMLSWRAFISKNSGDKNNSDIQPVWSGAAATFELYRFEKNQLYNDQLESLKKKVELRSGLLSGGTLNIDSSTSSNHASLIAAANRKVIAQKLLSLNALLNKPVTGSDENYFTGSIIDSLRVSYSPQGVKENFRELEAFADSSNNLSQLNSIRTWESNVSVSNNLLAADISMLTKKEFARLIAVTQNKGLFVFVAALLLLLQLWLILYLKFFDLGESLKKYGDTVSEEDKKLIAGVKDEATNCKSDLNFTETFIFLIALLTIPLFKSVPPNKVNLDDPIQQFATPFYSGASSVQVASTTSGSNPDVQIFIYGKPEQGLFDTVTVGVLDAATRDKVNSILNSVNNMNKKEDDKKIANKIVYDVKHQ